MRGRFLAVLFTVILLSACSFIPKYERPEAPVAKNIPSYGQLSNDNVTDVLQIKWEDFFTDTKLKKIIERAFKNNRDLKLAILNVEAARMIYGIKRGDLYPSFYASGQVGKSRISDDFAPKGKGFEQSQYNVNFGLAEWEIDFFGRIRSLKENALEEFFAAKENRRAAQIAMISEISRVYLTLAADIENYKIAKEIYNITDQNYKLVESQYKVGLITEIDLNRSKIALDSSRVNLVSFEQIIEKDKNALNLIVGAEVDENLLPDGISTIPPMREFSPGTSSEVLLNRPDIAAAEHHLKAANANIGAARAAIFPRISLLAGVGMASTDLSGLFNAGSRTWNVGSNITLPVFDSRVWQGYELSKIQKELYLTQYEKAIQTAFKEVLDTLIVRATIDKQIEAQKQLVSSLEKNYNLAIQVYNQGVDSYFSVLDANKNLLSAKQALTNLELIRKINHIQMFSAFGGGGNYIEEDDLKRVGKSGN